MLVAQHDQSPPLSRGLATTATIAYISQTMFSGPHISKADYLFSGPYLSKFSI